MQIEAHSLYVHVQHALHNNRWGVRNIPFDIAVTFWLKALEIFLYYTLIFLVSPLV